MSEKEGRIVKVAGPLVVARGIPNARMYDVVRVSDMKLIGEIIEIHGKDSYIQVYEDTSGLGPGEPVYSTNRPLTVELGPGLIESIYDGIQRPLEQIKDVAGDFITRGVNVPGLDRKRVWEFKPEVDVGDVVEEGDVLGTVQETVLINHKIMVPPGLKGKVKKIENGRKKIEEIVCVLTTDEGDKELNMIQHWPVRIGRPYKQRVSPQMPLITGQRVVDALFPIAKGGTACVPGPFGSGKTVIQHQLAKWADAEIVVFVGCGERGNEMTDVLIEFPSLKDPKSGEPLMKRTVLIANTSNMPVAAREASVYTGITIAEYYRDMGYSVAIMGDSTSRWAEALREMSGRLEEMPGEEGYPAYLGTRVASFYERAGRVKCSGSRDDREGALSVIGAVSPPGGDLSEPVTQNTLRVVKVFWSLEYKLAHARHFPAISWLNSYSLYSDIVDDYMAEEVSSDWPDLRRKTMRILQQEAELEEIVRLVGIEALSKKERLVMETAKSIREDFLHQNAFDKDDTYTSIEKQYLLLHLVLSFYDEGERAVKESVEIDDLVTIPVREKIGRAKFIPEAEKDRLKQMEKDLKDQVSALIEKVKQDNSVEA